MAQNDFTAIPAGANITFHRLAWESGRKSFSMSAGSDLKYHTLTNDSTALHTHEFAELFLVISGRIKHHINSDYQELDAGTLVFIRTTDVHGFEQSDGAACELVNVTFKLEYLRDLSVYLENDFFLRRYTGPVIAPTFKLSLAETDDLATKFIRMNTLQKTAHDIARLKIKILIADLFTRFFLDSNKSVTESEYPEWFEQLTVEMTKQENIIGGLARMKELSPRTQEHLCKCFRKYMNRTPTEYINELRIKHAAKQIVETDDKILSVALDAGYNSLSRFHKLFKQFYGTSPAKYRSMSRKNDIPIE